jgi:hypothetical protein
LVELLLDDGRRVELGGCKYPMQSGADRRFHDALFDV